MVNMPLALPALRGLRFGGSSASNRATGFSFLARPAGFEISQKLINFGEAASYFDVFLIALLNTLVLTAVMFRQPPVMLESRSLARLPRPPLTEELVFVAWLPAPPLTVVNALG